MLIEFLYTPHCPNAGAARELLETILRERRIPDPIQEVVIHTPEDASRVGFVGSPSIRIDGVDVESVSTGIKGAALSCRLYDGTGVPGRGLIEAALLSRETR